MQYAKLEDSSQRLLPKEKKLIQAVIGVFLYYGCTVDSAMLTTLSVVASAQAKSMEETMARCKQFIHYAATHQDIILTYKSSSDMVLVVHSDASYLSKSKARSRAGRHFFLSLVSEDLINNGDVLNLPQLFKAIMVMSSAAESELGTLYINAHKAIQLGQTLAEMGHKQPPTPTLGVVNNKIQP